MIFKKKRMFIHIGHGKTGTSSIQKFILEESRKESSKFCYPETTRIADAHHSLFKSDKNTLDTLFEEIISNPKKNIIISSESGLPNIRHFIENKSYITDFFKAISKQFDTKIIYYVRNHFDILESSFLQHTKSNNPELYTKLSDKNSDHSKLLRNHFFPDNIDQQEWINIAPTRQFNYFANIEDFWREIFGKRNILTKIYHKDELLNNDIVQDFIAFVDPLNTFLENNQQTYSENITATYNEKTAGYLLDNKTKKIIIEVFLDSNLKFSQNYLSKKDADLLLRGFI